MPRESQRSCGRRRGARAWSLRVPAAIFLAACLAGLGLSCSGQGEAAARPNIVVVVIDTLRADHLPFYGYGIDTSPFLASLAKEGVVFEHAYSTSSWTAPATASLFTALYPRQHGVITGWLVGNQTADEPEVTMNLTRIPEELETMPEAMRDAGYRTFGVSDNFNVCPQMGFADGFDVFSSDTIQYRGGEHVNRTVLGWGDRLQGPGPYFLYIHYMDPHRPYHQQRAWYHEPAEDRPALLRDPKRARAVARYDSEIGYVDDKLRELYRRLRWDRNTILVVTADHGEEFWDHGYINHDKTLYDEVLHVPLLVHDSRGGLGPARRAENVSLIDVLPTLLEIAGQPPDARLMGRSLVPLLDGAPDAAFGTRRLYAHLERTFFKPWGATGTLMGKNGRERYVAVAALDGRWKLIEDSRGARHLYDLSADPGETHDLANDDPKMAGNLDGSLKDHAKTEKIYSSRSFEEEVDIRELARLRSLGYVD